MRAFTIVLGLLLGVFGLLVGGMFAFVWLVYRDYEPIYMPHGMIPPADKAEEFFIWAVTSLVMAGLGGVIVLSQTRRPGENHTDRERR